jgi:S1-C subfamily serine protease
MTAKTKKLLIGAAILIVMLVAVGGGAMADRLWGIKPLDLLFPRSSVSRLDQRILTEESVVTKVAEDVSPSVVTVTIETPQRRILEFSPFGGFTQRVQGGEPQDIGTGFVVSSEGLIVTNKHVVATTNASYKVVTKDDKEYKVIEINRDPVNDIAILKIEATGLKPVELGDSGNLKVGQFVVAIGTALGEFRHTVTTGVISGLGRGITAGSVYEGYVEKLDDVIQTDAAINPGNSGGPLLNSAGQVIGVNVAVAQSAQNIGFAIPINTVKEALNVFKTTGKFPAKPYLGVQYQMISQQAAVLNNVPQGAYVTSVIEGSPAGLAGIEIDDIITKFDGQELTEKNTLADEIGKKAPGDKVEVEIWRNGETTKLTVTLSEFTQ